MAVIVPTGALVIAAVVLTSTGLLSSRKQKTSFEEQSGAKGLVFGENVIDIGDVCSGLTYRVKFRCENPTDREIRITDIRAGCKCSDFAAEMPVVSPHGAITIEGTIYFSQLFGEVTESVLVETDAGGMHVLEVKAKVVDRFVVEPAVIDWGTIYWDDTLAAEVVVRCASGSPVPDSLDILEGCLPELKAEVKERGVDRMVVRVSIDGPPIGSFFQRILLKTKESRHAQITIPVRAEVRGPITVNPRSLYLGPVPAGKQVTATLVCRMKPGYATRIAGITFQKQDIQVGVETKNLAESFEVTVTFTLPESKGIFKDHLVVKAHSPEFTHYIEVVAYVEDSVGQ